MKYMVIFAGMNGNNCLLHISSFLTALLLCVLTNAQPGWKVDWNADLYMNGGTGDYLPFWQRTGYDGIMPYTSAAILSAGADFRYESVNGIRMDAGANLVGQAITAGPWNSRGVKGFVDRLYISGSWKMFHLDIGMKPRIREFGDLSVTGGNIVFTGNARNMPGINAWSDWIYFEKGHWFGVRGNFAHYQTLDNRYVRGTMIHNKSLAFKVALGRKVDFEAGLDHWVQWGGYEPLLGQRPSTFKDYLRVILGRRGGADAVIYDQLNALGNHLGREYLRLTWRSSVFTMDLQYDMPFDDGAQIIKTNPMPDGVYTLKFAFNDRDALVTDLVYEFIHTTWQGGDSHSRPATEEEMTSEYEDYVYWQDPEHLYYGQIILGGCDDYHNNIEYQSGWTYFGRAIGLPLMIPFAPDDKGITMGMVCNRIRGHHIGIGGVLCSVPYSFKATYTSNWGRISNPEGSIFASRPKQLSLALEVELGEQVTNIPLTFAIGAYGDFGKVYRNSAGLSLRVLYGGSLRRP